MKTYKVIFTVFAAMILGALVITGCSSEGETSENVVKYKTNSIEKDIDRMKTKFTEITESFLWKEMRRATKEFKSNLPEIIRISSFENYEEIWQWIESNVNETGFENIGDAQQKHLALLESTGRVLEIYSSFWSQLAEQESEDIKYITRGWIDLEIEEPVANGPCENECINDQVSCLKDAKEKFTEGLANAASLVAIPPLAIAAALYLNLVYQDDIDACNKTFFSCFRAC